MKLLSRIPIVLSLLLPGLLCLAPAAAAQSEQGSRTATEPARVRSVRGLPAYDGPAIEIISDHPIVPQIRKLENPARLVIDLPNTTLPANQEHIDFRSAEIHAIRASQFQQKPAVARIVVDLAKPVTFSWDAAGNRLMVRLRAAAGGALVLAAIAGPVYVRDWRRAGRAELSSPRLLLHAATLGFHHPITGEPLRFAASPPPELEAALDALREVRR